MCVMMKISNWTDVLKYIWLPFAVLGTGEFALASEVESIDYAAIDEKFAKPTPAPGYGLLGDVGHRRDCEVDLWDMQILIENMGTDAGLLGGDLNEDGTVDDRDLEIMMDHLGDGCSDLIGDLRQRRDCVVDNMDLYILLYNWGERVSKYEGDINSDGVVNVVDLNILLGNWGKTCDALIGDLNNDCVVDRGDLYILRRNWGQRVGREGGDFNEDGVVDAKDLRILLGHFGDRCPPIRGDLIHKRNCEVDALDLAILKHNWGTAAGLSGGDLNSDGVVGEEDLAILLSKFGSVCQPLVGDLQLKLDCVVDNKDLVTLLWNLGEENLGPKQGDLNRDGIVNVKDLTIMLHQYGKECDDDGPVITPPPVHVNSIAPEDPVKLSTKETRSTVLGAAVRLSPDQFKPATSSQ